MSAAPDTHQSSRAGFDWGPAPDTDHAADPFQGENLSGDAEHVVRKIADDRITPDLSP